MRGQGVTYFGWGDKNNEANQVVQSGCTGPFKKGYVAALPTSVQKTRDGSYREEATCAAALLDQLCFKQTSPSASRVQEGDSGGAWVGWYGGSWVELGVEHGNEIPTSGVTTASAVSVAQARSQLLAAANAAGTEIMAPAAGTVVRDPATGNAWLVEGDGFRYSIPTGGDYNCFIATHPLINASRFDLNTIPEMVGSTATCTPPPPPSGYRIINADGGVYWRAAADWNTAIQRTGYGVYTGDRVTLDCWTRGGTVPPNWNNPLWYHATILSGRGKGSGYVNDHFLVTSTNQPNIVEPGVPPCGTGPPPPAPLVSASNNGGQMAVQLNNFPLGVTYFFCHTGDGSGYPTGGSISNHGQINVTSPNQSFASGLCSGSGNFWIGFQATDGHDYYSNQVALAPPPPPGCTAAPTISSYTLSQGGGVLVFDVSFRAYNGSWTFAATDSTTGQIVNGSSVGATADATSQHGAFNDVPAPSVTYDSTIIVTTACGSVSANATFTAPVGQAGGPPTITSIPDITIAADDAGSYPAQVNYTDDDCDVVGGTWLDPQGDTHDFSVGPADVCADGIGSLTPGYSSCTSPDGVRGTPGEYPQTITLQDSLGRLSQPYTFYVICQ
jgi:hypothetical protein